MHGYPDVDDHDLFPNRLRRLNHPERERVFLPLPAAPVLADRQPRVGDAAAELLIAEAGQHDVAAALLGVGAAGAGQQILAEVIDAQHEAADRMRHRL